MTRTGVRLLAVAILAFAPVVAAAANVYLGLGYVALVPGGLLVVLALALLRLKPVWSIFVALVYLPIFLFTAWGFSLSLGCAANPTTGCL